MKELIGVVVIAMVMAGGAVDANTNAADAKSKLISRPPHHSRLRPPHVRPPHASNGTVTPNGSFGIDISKDACDGGSWVSQQQFPCFYRKGVRRAIVESHNGGMGQTNSIAHCTNEAHNAGYSIVDVYAFFCPECSGNTPAHQKMQEHVEWLKSQGVRFGTLWLDIETCDGCWSSYSNNVDYIHGLVSGAQAAGAHVGVYTNQNEWAQVTGSAGGFGELPIWYAHYDNNPSYSDWHSFCGWGNPHMKQYRDTSSVGCYSNVDMDWY